MYLVFFWIVQFRLCERVILFNKEGSMCVQNNKKNRIVFIFVGPKKRVIILMACPSMPWTLGSNFFWVKKNRKGRGITFL